MQQAWYKPKIQSALSGDEEETQRYNLQSRREAVAVASNLLAMASNLIARGTTEDQRRPMPPDIRVLLVGKLATVIEKDTMVEGRASAVATTIQLVFVSTSFLLLLVRHLLLEAMHLFLVASCYY